MRHHSDQPGNLTSGTAQGAVSDAVGNGETNTYNQARTQLNGQGFNNVNQSCAALPDDTLPDEPRIDKVSSCDPAPGSLVVAGSPVTLTVPQLVCP